MKHVLTLADIDNLDAAKRIPVDEVLLRTSSFSKTGMIEDGRLFDCLDQLAESGKKVAAAWDFPTKDKRRASGGQVPGSGTAVGRIAPGVGAEETERTER